MVETIPAAGDSRLTFRSEPPGAKLFILADGDLLMRVFENLLSNTIRYGTPGTEVEVVLREGHHQAVIEVVNRGEPIPADDLPHLFDRFYRPEKSRSDQGGGSGLGLAIAKNIVELHGGTIAVRSGGDTTVFETRFRLM